MYEFNGGKCTGRNLPLSHLFYYYIYPGFYTLNVIRVSDAIYVCPSQYHTRAYTPRQCRRDLFASTPPRSVRIRRDETLYALGWPNETVYYTIGYTIVSRRLVLSYSRFVLYTRLINRKNKKKRYTRLRVLIFPPSSIVTLPKRLDGRRCQRDHARGRRLLGTRLDRLCRSVGSQRTLGINRVFLKPYGQSILKQCPGIVVCGVAAIRHRRCEIKNKYIRVLCC